MWHFLIHWRQQWGTMNISTSYDWLACMPVTCARYTFFSVGDLEDVSHLSWTKYFGLEANSKFKIKNKYQYHAKSLKNHLFGFYEQLGNIQGILVKTNTTLYRLRYCMKKKFIVPKCSFQLKIASHDSI